MGMVANFHYPPTSKSDMLSELVVFLSLKALQSLRGARAQSEATCTDTAYSWSFNSLNQNPCDIGRALGGVCISNFSIPALPSGYHYSGFGPGNEQDCVCNTVYYSLLNVCAACQGGSVPAWGNWDVNCTTIYQTFPANIPNDTAVPHYAYQSLLQNGTFNFAGALVDTGAEATHIASTSASVTSTSTSLSASNFPSATPTLIYGSSSSGSSSNTGVIAGGVVGGVVGFAIIAALIFLFRRRRPATIAITGPIEGDIELPRSPLAGQSLTRSTYASTVYSKVYDPYDPTTFPSANDVPYRQQKAPAGYFQSYAPIQSSTLDSDMMPNRFSPTQPTNPLAASTYRGAPEI
ncbi:hypothetical protein EDD18DRAFT_848689 [Armillaria luteobubalina]|uniref:Peptidase A1 domain-containing protein n=1 Tax=Armillaria luteobubalina TaxID=153913 RepID=A0AA39QCP4_9AGAR|nr:hypothetical protein EDD18DRAFT_848689 [Armillaria luteobubalina]